ncbi:MAG TPA: FixH family protein [Burkholderiaceae bacterium]|nr:FixH family protein [Burkholderiaceae bacterium]
MSRVALGALGALALSAAWPARAADDCGAALKVAQPWIAAADGARIAFVSRPAPPPVGQHFDLDFVVCAAAVVRGDAAIRVDADMPAHRHGMNYRATVSTLSPGVYRAHGLMFHMPGRWRVIFDLPLEGRTLRLAREIDVQ